MLSPISESDLREIYWCDRSQLGPALQELDNDLTTFRLESVGRTADGEKIVYFVGVYCSGKSPILDKELERWLCDNKMLLGQPGTRGRVAVRVNFFILPKYQQSGLATYVLSRERQVFRNWGAREIHVFAMEAGRWVWTRPRFGYKIDDFEFQSLQQKFKEWQRRIGAEQIRGAQTLADFPRDFLLSGEVNSLNLFERL